MYVHFVCNSLKLLAVTNTLVLSTNNTEILYLLLLQFLDLDKKKIEMGHFEDDQI
jgi:hypothetical protein